jgi:hypothetical protein
MDSSKVATSGASRLAEILTVKANEALDKVRPGELKLDIENLLDKNYFTNLY